MISHHMHKIKYRKRYAFVNATKMTDKDKEKAVYLIFRNDTSHNQEIQPTLIRIACKQNEKTICKVDIF